jgi:rubrerythrin
VTKTERTLTASVVRRCGYGIATARPPGVCPMCRGNSWEPVEPRWERTLDAPDVVE